MKTTHFIYRTFSIASILLAGLIGTTALQAAEPAVRPAPQPPLPLFFKESWKDTPAAVPLAQDVLSNPALELTVYGKVVPDVNNEGGTAHVWTGLCLPSCAVTLKNKASFVDLSGKARIKWFAKTSGFHAIRPVVKLADGRMLAGDLADAYTFDYHTNEFHFAEVHWMLLDAETLTTKGVMLTDVDLSKVDEVGFVDLTPGSGHGSGGYSDMGWIEVYGKPVAR